MIYANKPKCITQFKYVQICMPTVKALDQITLIVKVLQALKILAARPIVASRSHVIGSGVKINLLK